MKTFLFWAEKRTDSEWRNFFLVFIIFEFRGLFENPAYATGGHNFCLGGHKQSFGEHGPGMPLRGAGPALRQSFAVIWPVKRFKATFEPFIISIFWGGEDINLLTKNTAYRLIDKKYQHIFFS